MSQHPPPPDIPPQSTPYPPAPKQPASGLAVVSLVLGILSILFFCIWWIAIPLGALAIILGVVARNQARRGEAGGETLARAGLICGIVGVLLGLLLVVLFVVFYPSLREAAETELQRRGQLAPPDEPTAVEPVPPAAPAPPAPAAPQ